MSIPGDMPAAIERVDPPGAAALREQLAAYLDYHRATLQLKCAALSDAQLKRAACPPSNLTLLGLLRHLTEVERQWFQAVIGGREIEPLYYSAARPDGDFDDLDAPPVAAVWAAWHEAVALSREILDAHDLSHQVSRRGEALTVGWILAHMIEEYARHNGHADLVREAIDGERGE